jgi:hypothetical protein
LARVQESIRRKPARYFRRGPHKAQYTRPENAPVKKKSKAKRSSSGLALTKRVVLKAARATHGAEAANGPVAPTYQRKERAWAISPTKTVIANGAMQTATSAPDESGQFDGRKDRRAVGARFNYGEKGEMGQGGCRLSRRGIEGNRNRQ